jgi:PTH1 family peptidyl-tRNA hydrolase
MVDDSPWLVVGLGNPGAQYAGNRHNVGHLVLDVLAARCAARFAKHPRAQAVVSAARLGALPGIRVVLAQPTTYMNVSGGPVAGLATYYGIEPARIVVVHDEVDIPFDTIRLKADGGEGGHNGLRDISKALGTRDYVRVRVGVGRPPGRMDTADYVLRDFSAAERKELPLLLDDAADAAELVITAGLLAAQLKYHTARA